MKENIRVLSYNIHKGFNLGNRNYLLKEVRHAIREVDANLVLLQEVIGENKKHADAVDNWISDSQFEFIADEIWPHFAYGKNAAYDHGHHGNAILSKTPIDEWNNHNITRLSFSQRGILYGRMDKVHVFCLHFGLFAFERHWQLDKLIKVIKQIPEEDSLIIAGDFNDWTCRIDKKIKQQLNVKEVFSDGQGKPAKSFPAFFPAFRMDRI